MAIDTYAEASYVRADIVDALRAELAQVKGENERLNIAVRALAEKPLQEFDVSEALRREIVDFRAQVAALTAERESLRELLKDAEAVLDPDTGTWRWLWRFVKP